MPGRSRSSSAPHPISYKCNAKSLIAHCAVEAGHIDGGECRPNVQKSYAVRDVDVTSRVCGGRGKEVLHKLGRRESRPE